MSEYAFTDEMGEISGFGGKYEEACRAMVIAGAEWADEQGDDFEFDSEANTREVLDDHPGLDNAMVEACEEMGMGGPTGAMMHACVRHVYKAFTDGWDAYVEAMEERGDER